MNEFFDSAEGQMRSTRKVLFNTGEDLLRETQLDKLNDLYWNLPYAQQVKAKMDLGTDFELAFLDKEFKNVDAIPTDKLIEWVQRLGGKVPNMPNIPELMNNRVQFYSEPVADAVTSYYDTRDQQWPNITKLQDLYYSLPRDQQDAFLEAFPHLQDYWDWNRAYKAEHPEFMQFFDDRNVYNDELIANKALREMSDFTKRMVGLAAVTGEKLNATASSELKLLYERFADTKFMTFEDFTKLILAYK